MTRQGGVRRGGDGGPGPARAPRGGDKAERAERDAPTQRKQPDDLSDLAPALRRVLRRIGAPEPHAVARLEQRWQDVLGPAAPHARLVKVTSGQVVVEVDHPVWATRVQMARGRLEEALGEPARVDVRVRR